MWSIRSIFLVALATSTYCQQHCEVSLEHRIACGPESRYYTFHQCNMRGCCFEQIGVDDRRCYKGRTFNSYLSMEGIAGRSPVPSTQAPETTEALSATRPTRRVISFGGQRYREPEKDRTPGNPHRLSLLALVQMKRDNVPQEIINSLLADAIPGGEFFYYLQDGKVDNNELAELLQGTGVEWSKWLSFYLNGANVQDLLKDRLSDVYGVDPTVVELLMTNNKDPVAKHLVAVLSSNRRLNPLSSFVMHALAFGEGITHRGMTNFVIEQIFQHENKFAIEAYKALLSGDKIRAIQWSIMASTSRATPLKKHYPNNEALFAHFVDNKLKHPGRIDPSIILHLALNGSLTGIPAKKFTKHFGIKAFDYVCSVHSINLRLPCDALKYSPYHSTLQCINAGCCLHPPRVLGGRPECHENIIGKIGVAIAEKVWDEDYVIQEIFGGVLPKLEHFYPSGIPWIPSREIPAKFTAHLRRDPNQPDWFHSLTSQGRNLHYSPTSMPNLRPSKFRPNFVWKPHGATPYPYPTELPGGVIHLPTSGPGEVGGEHVDAAKASPIVQSLSSKVFSSCYGVKREDRYECMPNKFALKSDGHQICKTLDCCFDPDYSDLSIPACFRKESYGQCHLVEPEDRIDCGKPGITKDECLEKSRCCYDSTITADRHKKPVPWCYFKKESYVTSEERCSRVGHADRVGCFSNHPSGAYFGHVLSEDDCLAEGCCFEEVRVSFFSRTVLGKTSPPPCYRKLDVSVRPTEAKPTLPDVPPPDPAPEPTCKNREELDPWLRTDCGNYDYVECVLINECCYLPEIILVGAPHCYKRT